MGKDSEPAFLALEAPSMKRCVAPKPAPHGPAFIVNPLVKGHQLATGRNHAPDVLLADFTIQPARQDNESQSLIGFDPVMVVEGRQ